MRYVVLRVCWANGRRERTVLSTHPDLRAAFQALDQVRVTVDASPHPFAVGVIDRAGRPVARPGAGAADLPGTDRRPERPARVVIDDRGVAPPSGPDRGTWRAHPSDDPLVSIRYATRNPATETV